MNQEIEQTPPPATTTPAERKLALERELRTVSAAVDAERAQTFWREMALHLESACRRETPHRAIVWEWQEAIFGKSGLACREAVAYGPRISVDVCPSTPVPLVCQALEAILAEIRANGAELFAERIKLDRERADVLRAEFGKPSDPDATPTPF